MIIKLVYKPTNDEGILYKQTQVFSDITQYDVGQRVTKDNKNISDGKAYILSFIYKGELVECDLYNCNEAYIMNDDGKTIDTLRRIKQ